MLVGWEETPGVLVGIWKPGMKARMSGKPGCELQCCTLKTRWKLAVPLVQCAEMAIRLGESVCETRKPLGWQANEGALDVLLLNEAMGECVMTLKTFLSTAHLPTFPKQQRRKVEPLKLSYRFYSRRKYVVEEGIVTFTTLRFFYSEYRLLWTFFFNLNLFILIRG